MFKVILKTYRHYYIRFHNDFRIIPVNEFKRAKSQKERRVRIRKPVSVIIDGDLFLFKKNQWKKTKSLGSGYKKFCAGLPHLYKWEKKGRFKKTKKGFVVIRSDQ